MGNLEHAISCLAERMNVLTNRLGPVLTPTAPSENAKLSSAPTPGRSQLFDAISNQKARIEGLERIVNDLLSRIEI